MSEPNKLAKVLDLQSAIDRARRVANQHGDVDRFAAHQAEIERAERLARARPRLKQEDLHRLRTGDIWQTKHIAVVRAWLERGQRRILCLGGTTGTGKTFALAWAIAELGGAYLSAYELGSLSTGSWRQRERLEEKLRSAFLTLDDLGTERNVEDVHAPLLDLIDRRQGRPYRTIIATNLPKQLTPEQLAEDPTKESLETRYPEPRLWSRLLACWDYVGSAGEDLRRRK